LYYPENVLLTRERTYNVFAHTSGFGGGYRLGKNINGYSKKFLELEFLTMRHSKEIRTVNPYFDNARSYVYGKQFSMASFRGNYGLQNIIYSKPDWGGVEVRLIFAGGASLAVLKPVYLYIIHTDSVFLNSYYLEEERFDPDKHFMDNIYGRAPFLQGFGKLRISPGLHAKGAVSFEYGKRDERVSALEVGTHIDFFPIPLKLMAFSKEKPLFLNFYIALHFGKRYNQP